MGVALILCCLVLATLGLSSVRAGFQSRYFGFVVAGVGDVTFAATAAVTESWWLLLGGVAWLCLSPFLVSRVFGDPP